MLAATPTEHAGSASGLLATAQQIGGALGVAIAGTLFFATLGDGGYGDALAPSASFVALVSLACVALCVRLTGLPARVAARGTT